MGEPERTPFTAMQVLAIGLLGSGVVALLLVFLTAGCSGPSSACQSSPDSLTVWELVLAALCLTAGVVLALKSGLLKTASKAERAKAG